jgi:hypothetical protein
MFISAGQLLETSLPCSLLPKDTVFVAIFSFIRLFDKEYFLYSILRILY